MTPDILATLAQGARRRVEEAKRAVPPAQAERRALALAGREGAGPLPFAAALRGPGVSFICEVKKASPSKGVIAREFPYLDIARDYAAAGAAAISVLTEPDYFLGSDRYLAEISAAVRVPVLRKDFTVDVYQLYEAKCLGAHAVLLICALLDTAALRESLAICKALRLSALVETHTEEEVYSALAAGAEIIGANNRNLKDFSVTLAPCLSLRALVPPHVLFVAESGVRTARDVEAVRRAGADAVLIGEALMRSADKGAALAALRNGQNGQNEEEEGDLCHD